MGQSFKQAIHSRGILQYLLEREKERTGFLSLLSEGSIWDRLWIIIYTCDWWKGVAGHEEGRNNFSKDIEVGKHGAIGKKKSGGKHVILCNVEGSIWHAKCSAQKLAQNKAWSRWYYWRTQRDMHDWINGYWCYCS